MSASRVPPYLTMAQVADANGFSALQAKRLLQRVGIAEKIGGLWMVGESRLRERLPEVYDRVYAAFELNDSADQRRSADDRIDPGDPAS
jgi:hypothetical protein